ncbi:hypothetical protein ACJYYY_06290 [Brochothrix campestris]
MILLIVSTAVLLYLTITKKQQRHLRIIAALLLGLGLFQLFFATIIFPVLASVVLLSLAMMLLPLFYRVKLTDVVMIPVMVVGFILFIPAIFLFIAGVSFVMN